MKYDDVLDKVKKTEPILDDPKGLTENIMQRVKQSTAGAGRILALRISGAISGVAASALICLLAYETLRYPALPVENNTENRPQWTIAATKTYPQITGQDIQEKEKIIKTLVKSKETQRARKEQLSASFIVLNKTIKSNESLNLKYHEKE